MQENSSQQTVRIAMWSGPRNISTAMMRSWEAREDTVVCDEPFYAHYLRETGLDHPGREEVMASQDQDWRRVAAWLSGPVPEGKRVFYQKHMAHHLLTGMGRDWLTSCTQAFLIRDPQEMLTSLIQVTPDPSLEDTGLPQQWELFSRASQESETPPPVLDSRDVLQNPKALLTRLCTALDLPFRDAMLSWPAGPRKTDGVWAKHWYASVEASTGFRPYRPKELPLPPQLQPLLEQCRAIYRRLYAHRLVAPLETD